jgi:hypothetical protein
VELLDISLSFTNSLATSELDADHHRRWLQKFSRTASWLTSRDCTCCHSSWKEIQNLTIPDLVWTSRPPPAGCPRTRSAASAD